MQDDRPIEYIGDLDEVVDLKPRNTMCPDWQHNGRQTLEGYGN
jgi:hypothetical protein